MFSALKRPMLALQAFALCSSLAFSQDPTGIVEGRVTDPSGALVPDATVIIENAATAITTTHRTLRRGTFQFSALPVGTYVLRVSAQGFASSERNGLRVDVDRVVELPVQLQLATDKSVVNVSSVAATVDVNPTVGNVVTGTDAVDLPLNGRNLTQLGLLQPGVAPLTFGLLQAGGIARQNQGYSVNGQPPEENNYLLDGVSNVD